MLTDAEFRHGLFDPSVPKRRMKMGGRGVYVEIEPLVRALRERSSSVSEDELDQYVKQLGGQRVDGGRGLARLFRSAAPPSYYLSEVDYQRIRQAGDRERAARA